MLSRRNLKRLGVLGPALVVVVLLAVDHWLPYMLLSHHKFAVNPHPEVFDDYGATPEPVSFETRDGMRIAGWFVPSSEKSRSAPTVIVLHPIGNTRENMLGLMLPVWRKGFNLLLIDMRGHGESGGEFFTYGHHEWRDVTAAIEYLEGRQDGSAERVAVLGASAGAAVSISGAAHDSRIRAAIAIASFADLDSIVRHRAWFLPAFWRNRALRKAERLAQFKVSETSPVRDIAAVKCPILIAHGDADARIPFEHAEQLYNAAKCEK